MLHTYLTTSWHLRYPIIGAPMQHDLHGSLGVCNGWSTATPWSLLACFSARVRLEIDSGISAHIAR
jgi:hypothetical protein